MDPHLKVALITFVLHMLQMRNNMFLLMFSDHHRESRRRNEAATGTSLQSQLLQFELLQDMLVAIAAGCITERTMYSRNRPQGVIFWTEALHNFSDSQWQEHFRMSKQTFNVIVEQLRPALEKQTTRFKEPIDYKKRLAIVLWWLATPGEYRTISTLFGVGKATVCVLVREVCGAIKDILFQRYISLPTGERLEQIVQGFRARGFPQCAGAIDGTHLPVIAPHDSPEDYHNRKGWHSIILQAIVDSNYCFTDIYVGWPGRTHDARVFAHSSVFIQAEHHQGGILFPSEYNQRINGVDVPLFIIGDPAYPLKRWVMKGFLNNGRLTNQQMNFNFRLSSARMVVENAFGRLKGRWRRLMKRNDVETAFASDVIAACCVLHNICEIHKEYYNADWDAARAAEEAAEGLQQPLVDQHAHVEAAGNATAVEIRNAVMSVLH